MTTVALGSMSPAQRQGWRVLLDLGDVLESGWCLLGGQLVWLLAAEHGADPPRATDDVDVVVDVRTHPDGLRRLCGWLEDVHGFVLDGISPEGIGHRYARDAVPGPGRVLFDVLAPDHLGPRADLTTTPPARTLEAPGARAALDDAERLDVELEGRAGFVWRPPLLAAIGAKAATTAIPVRAAPERDWSDAAFLLTLVADPLAAATALDAKARRRLRRLDPLLDESHWAWRQLGRERARFGHTVLRILLASRT